MKGGVPSNPTPDLPDTMASAGAGRMCAPTSQRTDCSELQSSELQFPPVYHLVFYKLLLIIIRRLMFAPIRENVTPLTSEQLETSVTCPPLDSSAPAWPGPGCSALPVPRVRLNLEPVSITDGSITKYVDPHLKQPSSPTVRVDEICEEEILRPGIYVSEVGSCKLVSDKMYGCVENLAVWSQMARKVISVAHLWCKLRRKMLFIMIRIPTKLHKTPFSAKLDGEKEGKFQWQWMKEKEKIIADNGPDTGLMYRGNGYLDNASAISQSNAMECDQDKLDLTQA